MLYTIEDAPIYGGTRLIPPYSSDQLLQTYGRPSILQQFLDRAHERGYVIVLRDNHGTTPESNIQHVVTMAAPCTAFCKDAITFCDVIALALQPDCNLSDCYNQVNPSSPTVLYTMYFSQYVRPELHISVLLKDNRTLWTGYMKAVTPDGSFFILETSSLGGNMLRNNKTHLLVCNSAVARITPR